MVKKVSGSADFSPNLPAVEADAHSKAKAIPVRIYFKLGDFKGGDSS
jgi:hypothetical protein